MDAVFDCYSERTRQCTAETVFLCIEHVCSAEKGSVAFASTIHQSTYTWPRVLGESLRDVDVQILAVLHAQKSA